MRWVQIEVCMHVQLNAEETVYIFGSPPREGRIYEYIDVFWCLKSQRFALGEGHFKKKKDFIPHHQTFNCLSSHLFIFEYVIYDEQIVLKTIIK